MASHQPVPSRAALNALRGVILTTSCSVVLLAEERRRRLQIARAAIDNARKLHSVQNNRGPIALAECHGTWNGRFADVDDGTLSLASFPRPRTSTRRRGRTQMIGTEQATDSCEHDDRQTQPVSSRVESDNEHTEPSHTSHFLGNCLSMATFQRLDLNSLRSNAPHASGWKARRRGPRLKFSSHAIVPAASESSPIVNKLDASAGTNSKDTMIVDEESANQVSSLEAARQYIQRTGHENAVSGPCYDEVIPILERLLTELETCTTHGDLRLEKLNVVGTIFDRLATLGPLPRAAQTVRLQAIRFFRIFIHSCPEVITATLSSLLPLSKDPLKLLVPLTIVLLDSNHREYLRQVFLFLSRDSTLCSWAHGTLAYRLLIRLARSQQGFLSTKQLYLEFQALGLFSDILVPKEIEYKTRRLMIILALEAEEKDFASTELRKLEEVDPGAIVSDIPLQQHVIARKASNGDWDQVWSDIDALRQTVNPQCVEFQRLLTWMTDIFVTQCWNRDEVEAFLRKAVADFNLCLKPRWVNAVLDGYASRRQAESAISWLQFCGENGLLMDSFFVQQFFARCRKYWSFSEKAIRRFARLLNAHGVVTKQSPHLSLSADPDGRTNPASSLKQAVLELLELEPPDMERARQLIAVAHKEGCDVREALTSLIRAQIEQGGDPRQLIDNALQSGVRLFDSTYNKAAQALSAAGNHKAAADMCVVAARENGNGQLLYNEYNFANLVFAHTGSASYTALQSVLSEFTSEAQWWHGSPTCKETIKLAMKATVLRAVADEQNSELHRQALDHLDTALLHVKECRPTKKERLAVLEAYVRFAKAPPPKASEEGKRRRHGCGADPWAPRDAAAAAAAAAAAQTLVDDSVLAVAASRWA
ncbi:hypothetical protein E4U54_006306 [Claviceps lovelessii]|nr:hypothetical protein E4U54_006306 [Claviceps lovelessii]